MKILIACEFSGVVREAFTNAGHDAVSCDLLPSEKSGLHLQCDVLTVLDSGWDLMVAFPPCTYLCSSGLHWNKRRPERQQKTEEALMFVKALWEAPIPRIAIENPVGCLSTHLRKPDQILQPYQFGHDASKTTCLWLKNLPMLRPSQYVKPRLVNGKPRWSNQTDSGQNRLGPHRDRWKQRSITYKGIAEAMAEQWAHLEMREAA